MHKKAMIFKLQEHFIICYMMLHFIICYMMLNSRGV
jgi:hypothetical protein